MKEMINSILEAREGDLDEMKKILDRAQRENRDLTAKEAEKFDRITADLDAKDARLKELSHQEKRNKDLDEQRGRFRNILTPSSGGRYLKAEEEEIRTFLHGDSKFVDIDFTDLHVERGETGGYQVRTLSKLTSGAGGNTVDTSFAKKLYEHLIASSAIRMTNVTVLTTDGGEAFQIPKTTAHGGASLVAEAGTIPASDPTFGQVTLDAWKYGKLVQLSTELVQDAAVDILGYLAREGAQAVGNASGAHFISGTGTGQPRGVMTAASVGVTGGAGVAGVPTADNLIDLFFSVLPAHQRNAYWLMNPTTLAYIRKLKDSGGRYVVSFDNGLGAGNIPTIMGRPVVTDPNVPATGLGAKSIAFGDFSAYYIRDVRGIRFERSDDFAFGQDLVSFRAVLRTDGDLIDESGAIKAFQGNAA